MCVVKKLLDGKKIILIFIFCLIAIPVAFAADDANQTNLEMTDDSPQLVDEAENYYFNASAENDDGNGSASAPYKYITPDRIKDNANHYLSEGEYQMNATKQIKTSTIIGSGADKTIVDIENGKFIANTKLILINLTVRGMIKNYGVIEATNTIFCQGHGESEPFYENYYGGAIYSPLESRIILTNCTFIDNHADYGGAIYMGNGYLEIKDCQFISNYANNYGGAIACENSEGITVSNTRFTKNNCTFGAGGAIYLKDTKLFNGTGIEISNSNASFGAAIASINSTAIFDNSKFSLNNAKWNGGAIFHLYGDLICQNSEFRDNYAENGGGLFIDYANDLTVKNNEFANNAAGLGSAVYSIFNFNASFDDNEYANNEVYETNTLNLEIGDGNYATYQFIEREYNITPQYILSDDDCLTPVKDQENSGNCWAFAAIAALETCLKRITGSYLDLSEENMKNLVSIYSDYGTTDYANNGGYPYLAWQYLTSWLGPVNEIDDVFDDKSVLSPILKSVLHVQNIIFLSRSGPQDNDEIKEAILKYGAVVAKIHYDKSYLNNRSYYYPLTTFPVNHDLIIVGWDDNYSRNNFKTPPQEDGAWIVQSSWGTEWADSGYGYVSYYDGKFLTSPDGIQAFTFVLNDTYKLDKNYQYDIVGVHKFLYNDTPSAWYKTKFTSTDNEVLKAVSTYFEKPTNWTLTVNVNGALKTMKTGQLNAGYWTIDLDESIPLYEGDEFEIIFNTTCEGPSAVPVCEGSKANANETSYISYDGSNWMNLFDSSQTACIKAFTILSRYDTVKLDISYDGYNPVNITASIIDQFGNYACGNVTFDLNGMKYSVKLSNGSASIVHNFNKKSNNISVSFKDASNSTTVEILKRQTTLMLESIQNENSIMLNITSSESINATLKVYLNEDENSINLTDGHATYSFTNLADGTYLIRIVLDDFIWESENSTTIEVKTEKEPSPSLSGNKNIVMYYGAKKTYSVKVFIDSGIPAGKGETVKITLNSKVHYIKTDQNGIASITISLKPKTYTVTAEYKGVKVKNKITVKPTLITKNVKAKKGKTVKFKVTLLNTKGKAIKGKKVTVKVKGKKYKLKTNKKGKAVLKIKKLKAGKYKVVTTYRKLKNTNWIRVKK